MAGSWNHIVSDNGRFLDADHFSNMIENLGDAYEALEECFGMIVWLTHGNTALIQEANEHYMEGVERGTGVGDKERASE